ncbi:MAG TPA: hypothetical protein DEA08_04915 [Planctomycetes bacterium]|nr:hypothetical protein [Planctomycetota bacterium]
MASTHAYEVVELREEEDGSRFVILRNPWGHMGRTYKTETPSWLKRLFGASPVVSGRKQEQGNAFTLDLGDLARYGQKLHFSEGGLA